jgi:hypothetical protein
MLPHPYIATMIVDAHVTDMRRAAARQSRARAASAAGDAGDPGVAGFTIRRSRVPRPARSTSS